MRLPSPSSFLVLGTILGGFWLISFSAAVITNTRNPAEPGAVTPIRTCSRVLFTPPSLVQFVRDHPPVESHEQLVSLLNCQGLGDAWYAILCVEEMNTGERSNNLYYVRLGQVTHRFGTIQADLAKLAGRPPLDPASESEGSRVVVIPEELARLDPREVVPDLIERDKAR